MKTTTVALLVGAGVVLTVGYFIVKGTVATVSSFTPPVKSVDELMRNLSIDDQPFRTLN
jgi:hypothetical protein